MRQDPITNSEIARIIGRERRPAGDAAAQFGRDMVTLMDGDWPVEDVVLTAHVAFHLAAIALTQEAE
jgi:hypothetical protein